MNPAGTWFAVRLQEEVFIRNQESIESDPKAIFRRKISNRIIS